MFVGLADSSPGKCTGTRADGGAADISARNPTNNGPSGCAGPRTLRGGFAAGKADHNEREPCDGNHSKRIHLTKGIGLHNMNACEEEFTAQKEGFGR